MSIQLKRASYKGVEFQFESVSTTGGLRTIKFNYPGSDRQAIEVQGKAPRNYPISIIIPHDNYHARKAELYRVLEDGEKGVFVHPVDGEVNNVINGIFTLTEITSEIGKAKITVTFEVDDAPGIPQQSGNLASQVQQQSTLLNTQLAADLGDNYKASLNFSGNFSDALDNIDNISAAIAGAITTSTPIPELSSEINRSLKAFNASVGDLAQAPTALASSVSGLFESTNSLFADTADTLGAMQNLFDFGANDPIVRNNTAGRAERNRNRDLIRTNMKTQALSYAYLNAVQVDYATTDDLGIVQDSLESQYLDIRNGELVSNNALELLDRVRVQAQKTLDQVAVNTSSIITIDTTEMPLSVLVYQYYGSTDLVDTIAQLNNINQNAFVSGEIKVLTA